MIKRIKLLLIITALSSCAQIQKGKVVSGSNEVQKEHQAHELPKVSKEIMLQRLDLITEQAVAAGDEAIEFLATDLFFKANDASLKGDPLAASVIFKYVVKLKPDDLFLRKKYAVELIKSSQLVEAREHLNYLVTNADDEISTKAKLLLAGVYSALQEKKKAIKLYREIVTKDGVEISEACIFLSKTYVSEGKFKRAFSVLDYCAKKNKKERASFAYYKGKIEFDRDRIKKAYKHLVRAIKFNPTHYQSVVLLGHLYELQEKNSKAMALYETYLKSSPSNYTVLNKYVNLLFSEGKYQKVIPHLEKLLAIDENNLNLKVRLGVLYTEIGKLEDAKGVFTEILAVVPSSDKVLYYLASLYQQTSEDELAIEYFSKIGEESSLFHDSNVQIGQILNVMAMAEELQGKKGEAHKLFVDFVNRRSESSVALNVELHVMLAGYYEAMKNNNEAVLTMEKVKDKTAFDDAHEYYLAALYEKVKDYGKADKIIYTMLEKNPENPHALNFMGYSLLERGQNMPRAFKYISAAVKLRPDDGYIRDSLSWYYYKNGKIKDAYREAKKAWSLVNDDVVISKHLALIYKAMNNYDKAKEYYVEALKSCKEIAEREEVIQGLESLEALRMPASR